MENIRQALERAKSLRGGDADHLENLNANKARGQSGFGVRRSNVGYAGNQDIELNVSHLQSRRIVSHDGKDPRSKAFDMLRTQVLQSMDLKDWKTLAITSPTPACGKTLTSLNLAFSIARQPDRSVVLVDLDLQRPQVASCLGLRCEGAGVLDVLVGRSTLSNAIVQARIGKQQFFVLPTAATSGSSELMSSREMAAILQGIRGEFPSSIVILDMPPILSGDDVITILPQIDCILLVACVGTSTVAQIEECNKHLQSTDIVRVVLNKVPELTEKYYYYY
jgi:protein-tyrosine kinase